MAHVAASGNEHYLHLNPEQLVRDGFNRANIFENNHNPGNHRLYNRFPNITESHHQMRHFGHSFQTGSIQHPLNNPNNYSYSLNTRHDTSHDIGSAKVANASGNLSQVISSSINLVETGDGISGTIYGRHPPAPFDAFSEANHRIPIFHNENPSMNSQAPRDCISVREDSIISSVNHIEGNHDVGIINRDSSGSYSNPGGLNDSDVSFEDWDVKPTVVDEDIYLSLNDEYSGGKSFLCRLCGKSFAVVDSFDKSVELHAKLHHDALYSCSLCDKKYRWSRSLDKHLMKVHPGAVPFQCQMCGKGFRNNYSLSSHQKLHCSEKHDYPAVNEQYPVHVPQQGSVTLPSKDDRLSFPCQECARTYLSKGSLMKHMRLAHSEDSLCKCETCGKECKNEYVLKVHMQRHNTNSMCVCSICESHFSNKILLRQHMETHELGKPICEKCGREFSTYDNLRRHVLLHSSDVHHLCDVCGKTFFRTDKFNKHMRIHSGEKPFSCLTCKKPFRDRFSLKIHSRKHTGEKPFLCNVCGKSFSNKGTLKMHISRHTGDSQYKCPICDKIFAYNTYRTAHMRTHTSEKPFKCTVCSKEFTQKSSLNFHMGSHSGEKKHKCNVCDKAFMHVNYLNVHMRSHTGEKPYKCSICQKGFSQRSSLNTHMRICA